MTALPQIPLLDVGVDWPFEVLRGQLDRVNALLDESGGRIPELAIKVADAISRRWLERWHPLYQEEINCISVRIARPGAYFLNLSYEMGVYVVGGTIAGWPVSASDTRPRLAGLGARALYCGRLRRR
jgi:hypothetical protein